MARLISTLLIALVGLVALALASPARAAGSVTPIPNQVVYQCYTAGYTYDAPFTKDKAASCAAWFAVATRPGNVFETKHEYTPQCHVVTNWSYTGGTIFIQNVIAQPRQEGLPAGWCGSGGTDTRDASFYQRTETVCPDSSTGTPSTNPTACTCDAGSKPNAAQTACIGDCKYLETASSGYFDIGTSAGAGPPALACKGKCQVVFDGTSPSGSGMIGGVKHWYAKGAYVMTGSTCSPAAEAGSQVSEGKPTKDAPQDEACKPGETAGKINNKQVCYKESGELTEDSKDKASSTSEKTSVTNPDGSVTQTETRVRVDAKGNKETTITKTRTMPDGTVIVTRDVENPFPGTVLGGRGSSGSDSGTSGSGDPGNENPNEERDECDKHPSSAGCGGDAAQVGELYAPKGKTLDSVLGTARDQFMVSPFGSAASNFFSVSNPGACPTWSASLAYFHTTLTIDQLCTPFGVQALAVLKMAILLAASFFAFRIAVE